MTPSAVTPGRCTPAPDLPAHRLAVALVRPQIPQNVGNVARTCVATGTRLHLVRPTGFPLDDRRMRRSGLDYWPRLHLTVHDGEDAFFGAIGPARCWLFDSAGTVGLFDASFADGDVLVFGSETHGLTRDRQARHAGQVVRIPQQPGERCLNLATSVGIATYAALARVVPGL